MKKKIVIKSCKNGPYVVSNLSKIKQSNGSNAATTDPTIGLCRCGASECKPFCDGSHGQINFNSNKSEDCIPRKSTAYVGKEITIHDDRGICCHAGFCTSGLPKVFRMRTDPWIDPNGANKQAIIDTIKKCPSGALSYSIKDIQYDSYSDHEQIQILEDGPYVVNGSIELVDDDKPESEEHYALCRCGESKNKPFCNGQHWYINFKNNGLVKKKSNRNCSEKEAFDNKLEIIQKLSQTGESENSAMRTLKAFPDFKTILFKGSQLHQMPLNEDEPVSLKTIIGKTAKKPLELSIPFYVSHMSFGAISKEAKIALAKGSSLVGTAMCSGEGGMLPESRRNAKKYIYELGTAAFSHDEEVMKRADAIELKIGQGVKPGVGGYLPGEKVTPEIARIRHIKPGEPSYSPGRLAGIDDIQDLINKVKRIRAITNGIPIGIKFSAGHIEEDISYALMAEPDFITIDCRGGGTGSSPTFLKDNSSMPPIFAISRARRILNKLNSDVTLCVTGGFRDSSDIAKGLALGADAIALATASLISIGCLQSKVCHTGTCPAGIATQDKCLRELFNEDKALEQFQNFYNGTAKELEVFARSNGKDNIHKLNTSDLMTTSNEVSFHTNIKHV